LTSKKNSLENLIFFGCDAYVYYVPKDKRSKLDYKVEIFIFIGYKDGIKGYKILNPITKIIVYSRYVLFREVKDAPK
jgi:hypothetical protein